MKKHLNVGFCFNVMALVKDKVDHVYLSVDNPSAFAEWFQQKTQTPSGA